MEFKFSSIPSQKGKVAIVTGANNGIGYETTVGLAKVGFKVIMACRNISKAHIAKTKILQKLPNADLEVIHLDLSDLESVREFVKEFKSKYNELHVLINNAGVLSYSGKKNDAGIELQFATNHLGHFLLTSLLIDMMPNDSNSRIVSLSSVAHKRAKIHLDDINCENADDAGAAYDQSKLACLMFGDELNRRLNKKGSKIRSLSVHPGGSDSGLFDEMSRLWYFTLKVLAPFITHSNEKAAIPSLYAALSDDIKGGEYFGPTGFNELKGKLGIAYRTDYSKNEGIATGLWELSEKMIGEKFKL